MCTICAPSRVHLCGDPERSLGRLPTLAFYQCRVLHLFLILGCCGSRRLLGVWLLPVGLGPPSPTTPLSLLQAGICPEAMALTLARVDAARGRKQNRVSPTVARREALLPNSERVDVVVVDPPGAQRQGIIRWIYYAGSDLAD